MATVQDKDTQTNINLINGEEDMTFDGLGTTDLKIEFIDTSPTGLEDSKKYPDTYIYSISDIIDLAGYGKLQILLSLAAGCVVFTDAMEVMILSLLSPVLE